MRCKGVVTRLYDISKIGGNGCRTASVRSADSVPLRGQSVRHSTVCRLPGGGAVGEGGCVALTGEVRQSRDLPSRSLDPRFGTRN